MNKSNHKRKEGKSHLCTSNWLLHFLSPQRPPRVQKPHQWHRFHWAPTSFPEAGPHGEGREPDVRGPGARPSHPRLLPGRQEAEPAAPHSDAEGRGPPRTRRTNSLGDFMYLCIYFKNLLISERTGEGGISEERIMDRLPPSSPHASLCPDPDRTVTSWFPGRALSPEPRRLGSVYFFSGSYFIFTLKPPAVRQTSRAARSRRLAESTLTRPRPSPRTDAGRPERGGLADARARCGLQPRQQGFGEPWLLPCGCCPPPAPSEAARREGHPVTGNHRPIDGFGQTPPKAVCHCDFF